MMETSTSAAENWTGLLQTLSITSHPNDRDTPQVLPSSNGGTQGGYAFTPADASEGDGQIERGRYYMPSGYLSSSEDNVESYSSPICDWDDHGWCVTAEAVEPQLLASLNKNTHAYHASVWAYSSQGIFAPYSSGTLSRGNGQSHNASHGNPCTGSVYQHSVLPDASVITSSVPTIVKALKKNNGDSFNKPLVRIAPGNYYSHLGAPPTCVDQRFFAISSQTPVSHDVHVGYEGSTAGASCFGSSEVVEVGHGLSSPRVFGQFGRPLAPLLVNASGQFCGVAEMVGPVDFSSSLEFWQQDKWTGKVPLKWHIVKDVPNSQFRHIVLENNDNKPVTNSRDTQEVPLSQGFEMLNIFKNHSLKTSILDDFLFYETQQRLMQEKKARQQTQLQRQQANSKGIKEKSEQKEMAQSMPHSVDAGRAVEQTGNLSKPVDVLERDRSLKVGTTNNQASKSKASPGA